MRRYWAQMLDSDARAVELHLLLGALANVAFIVLTAFDVIARGRPFDMVGFGTGLGLVMAATGIASVAQGVGRRAQGPPA